MNSSLCVVTDALFQAFRGGPPLQAESFSFLVATVEQAYAVQAALVDALDASEPGQDAGTARAWKSGGPSREATLTHSPLPRAGVRASGCDTRGLHLRQPGIEAEIALRVRREVSAEEAASLSHEDAVELVDAMCVSIEVVDSRWSSGKSAPALLKLADVQSHGALVLGDWVPFRQLDWPRQRCSVAIGNAGRQQFEGTHSLADPTWLLPAWLQHATASGRIVGAGSVVTTGTWCGWLDAAHGDSVDVAFPGIGRAVTQLL